MVSSTVTIVFVCWEIHKGKYMPVSCNKLAGKKMDECLWTPVPFQAIALRTLEKWVITPALPHVSQGNDTPKSGLHKPEDTFFQSLEMHFKIAVQMFTLLCLPHYFHQVFHAFSLWCLRKWKQDFFGNFCNLWYLKAGRRRNGDEDCSNLMQLNIMCWSPPYNLKHVKLVLSITV